MIINPICDEIDKKIRVVSVPVKEFKTAQINVVMLMPRTVNLAANMIIPHYLSHSTAKYPTLAELSAKLDSLYGTLVAGTSTKRGESSRIELSAVFIDNRFALDHEDIASQCLELLMQMLFEPDACDGQFNAERFEVEKRLAIESVENEKNDKRSYAMTRMIETMCADEVYGIPRSEILDDLKNTTAQSAFEAWRELLEKATFQINIIGDSDHKKSCEIIRKYFSRIKRNPVENDTLFVEQAQDVTEKTEEMDINQSKLVLGYRSGMKDRDDGYFARMIMTDVFGGGPYSRLFMNVREKLSLCYYCSARLLREKGIIVIQSGIEKDNRQKVLDEIERQLDVMKNGEFDEADFEASKTAVCDSLRGVFDTPDGIDAYLTAQIDDSIVPIDEKIKAYESVTREDIIDAAKQLSLDTVYMLAGKGSDSDE